MIRKSLRALFERSLFSRSRNAAVTFGADLGRTGGRRRRSNRGIPGAAGSGFSPFRAIARMRRLPFDQRHAIRKRVTLCRRPSAN